MTVCFDNKPSAVRMRAWPRRFEQRDLHGGEWRHPGRLGKRHRGLLGRSRRFPGIRSLPRSGEGRRATNHLAPVQTAFARLNLQED